MQCPHLFVLSAEVFIFQSFLWNFFHLICFSSVIVWKRAALFLKCVIVVKISFFIDFFYPGFYSSLSLLPALISPFDLTSEDPRCFFATYTARHCGKKTKTKRSGAGLWKEWIEVQGKRGTEAL